MTEDQIKAIAEEYSSLNPPCTVDVKLRQNGVYLNATMVFEPFLRFLNERFCIVEREKVEQEYVYACGRSDQGGYYDGKAEVLEDLFGDSMFNQNEE